MLLDLTKLSATNHCLLRLGSNLALTKLKMPLSGLKLSLTSQQILKRLEGKCVSESASLNSALEADHLFCCLDLC